MNKELLLAARPKTLPASLAPVLLGLALASMYIKINIFIAALTIVCTMLLQISTNLVNDYYDGIRGIDGEDRLGPERLSHKSDTNKKNLKYFFILTFALAFAIGIYLMFYGGLPIVIIGLSSLIFAYAYTGGPFPLSYYALGELLALIFFGPVAVWGTFYLQTKSFQVLPVIIGLGPGLISAAIMAINNLRDRASDSKTKKITLATLSSERIARMIPVFLVIASSFIPLIHISFFKGSWYLLTISFVMYLFVKTWNALLTHPISKEFNNHLAQTGKYVFIYSATYSLVVIFL